MLSAFLVSLLTSVGCANPPSTSAATQSEEAHVFPVTKTPEQWRAELTPEEYRILRDKGTERAFTGKYWDNHEQGVYHCAACGQIVFTSADKFESGTGWPSYTRPAEARAVVTESDTSYGMRRVEVMCGNCGGHLGHVFDDGPRPTGERWCINGNALEFAPATPATPAPVTP